MSTLISTIKQLDTRLNDHEQYIRRDCFEIKDIPVEDEDTNQIVKQVAELIDVDIRESNISISHRLPVGKPWTDQTGRVHQPREYATDFYNSRFKLKGQTIDDLECISSGVGNNIYVSESLNPSRKKLFRSCLKVKKELNYKFISTQYGQIFMKKDKSTPSIKISRLTDLAKLKSSRQQIPNYGLNGD